MSSIRAFLNETTVYGLGNAFSRVLAMMLIPLYAAYLGKIDYSNLVMLQSGFSVLSFLLALNSGVFFYFYETEDKEERRGVFASWYYYQVAVAIVLGLALFLLAPPLSKLYITESGSGSDIQAAIPILALQFLPYIINITNINLYRVQRKPVNVIKIVLTEAMMVLLLTGIGLRFLDFGLYEVIAAQCVARFMVALFFWRDGRYYFPFRLASLDMIRKLFLFSWPFFIISSLSWAILSIDKYIGAKLLTDKEEVAYLALAMQLTIPITILADMIRMAIGPFVMSIRKSEEADKTYQQVFDLSVFAGVAVLIMIVAGTPLMTWVLADPSYNPVLRVVPLIAVASILSLMANQIALSFSLVKKNVFILYGTAAGSIIGLAANIYLMPRIGYVASGAAQILSYLIMGSVLYVMSKSRTDNKIVMGPSAALMAVGIVFSAACMLAYDLIVKSNIFTLIPFGIAFLIVLATIYFRQQGIGWAAVFKKLRNFRA